MKDYVRTRHTPDREVEHRMLQLEQELDLSSRALTISNVFVSERRAAPVAPVRGFPVLPRAAARYFQGVKAWFEFAAACGLLVLLGPVMLIAGLLVRLTSRGPAVYTQTRLGLNGKPFQIYKLRTMTHDCEKATGPVWAGKNDPRVTWLGSILRLTHIDELPQLFNVLRGEMSLVGPRPERPEFVVELEKRLPNYRGRLAVRPGITGLAQILQEPDVDVDSVRNKLRYDLLYIGRASLALDLRICFYTLFSAMGLRFHRARWVRQCFARKTASPAIPRPHYLDHSSRVS